ncbi:MAG: Mur ligase family protein, partial [Gemmatimonadaceae bacterium]
MSFWTLDRVVAALGDELRGSRPRGSVALRGVSTDTRALARDDVFVALRGEQFDGHAFVAAAVERGAAAVIVSDPAVAAGDSIPVFVVRDTTRALSALGRFRRRVWGGPVIAVAGSNGKTSTKELIAAALGSVFAVHATHGNLNNQVGVPLSLLGIPDHADV